MSSCQAPKSNSSPSAAEKRARVSERRRELRQEKRLWLYEYLLDHPCVDCGEDDPVVLEFDHQHNKELDISRAVNDWSQERIEREIAKCEVVCSNCHKRRTAISQDWLIARLHYSS